MHPRENLQHGGQHEAQLFAPFIPHPGKANPETTSRRWQPLSTHRGPLLGVPVTWEGLPGVPTPGTRRGGAVARGQPRDGAASSQPRIPAVGLTPAVSSDQEAHL